MKKILIPILGLLLFTTLNAQQRANTTIDAKPLFEDLILPDVDGIFRGVDFNMSKSQVLKIENRETTSIYADEEIKLIITSDMGADFNNFADIYYWFDENGLDYIELETYAISGELSVATFEMVKDYYTQKMGKHSINENGFMEFHGKHNGQHYTIEIDYVDIANEYGMYIYIHTAN